VSPGGRAPSVASARSVTAHELADRENQARVRANRRRVQVLCAGGALVPALVVGVVLGVVAGAVVGAVVAVVVMVVVAAALARRSLPIALGVIGGRAVADDDRPALANLVDGLSATVGVARPDLWLVDDAVPNACALAEPGGRGVLVVTTGLLDALGLIEMEGVVAHELAHLKRHDASASAVSIATAGLVARVTGRDELVHRAVGRGREYGADREAVLAVRYPPGLHDALEKMATGPGPAPGSPFSGGRWAATRWVWIDPMVGSVDRAPAGELDATGVRVAALAEW
jgi:heat shock protein HtpX